MGEALPAVHDGPRSACVSLFVCSLPGQLAGMHSQRLHLMMALVLFALVECVPVFMEEVG